MASRKVPDLLRSFWGSEASSVFLLVLQVSSPKFAGQAHLASAICAGFVHSGVIMICLWPPSRSQVGAAPCDIPWLLNAHVRASKKFCLCYDFWGSENPVPKF